MAKQKLSSFKDLAVLVGKVPTAAVPETVYQPNPKKTKVRAKIAEKVDTIQATTAVDVKSIELPAHLKPKKHRPAADKVVVHKDPGAFRITPIGQKEVGKAACQGASDLDRFKTKLEQMGLELHGSYVRRKKTFADEVCNNPDTPEQIKLVKEYQGFYDDQFRRKAA